MEFFSLRNTAIMAENIEDLSIAYTEEGQLTVKELDKVILSRGAWTTIIYQYQELDQKTGAYGSPKFSIRRYQKRNNAYQLRSKFNISSIDQAEKIIEALQQWLKAS